MVMKHVLWLVIVILFSVVVSPTLAQTPTAWELLGVLNEARVANGLLPLTMNTQLTEAAQRHSNDMALQDALFHQGSDGTWFWDRVSATGYPLVNGAENVLYRFDTSGAGAYAQWRDSPEHNGNMVSALYVEVGIAYAYNANSGKYYFTMVLGSRADFLPPTSTPAPLPTSTPIPTITSVPPTNTPASIAPTNTPTLLPATFSVLATWTPVPTLPRIFTQANWLPRRLFSFNRTIWVIPTPTLIPPTPMPTNTPFPTSTPRPMDLLLVYNYESFTVMNISGRPLYMDGLSFYSPTGEMFGRVWDNGFMTASLNAFPNGDCLQAWNRDFTELPKPDFCGYRHSWMRLSDLETFWWNTNTFDVYQWENRVGTCLVSDGRCEINLSDRLPSPTPIPQVNNQTNNTTNNNQTTNPASNPTESSSSRGVADVRLIYTADSFTLINTAGRNLNLSGIGFSGEGGLMSLSEWDNGFLSRPLYDFPSGDCLQAWQIGLQNPPSKPTECTWRHAYLTVADYRMFWALGSAFTVSMGGNVLATCTVSAGVCDFNLP